MTIHSNNLCLLALFCYKKALKCMTNFKHIQENQNSCFLPVFPLGWGAIFPLAHIKARLIFTL